MSGSTAVYMPGVAGSVAILKPPRTPAQKKKIAAAARGQRLERNIKTWLESRGWRVELAPKVLRRYFDASAGKWARRSARHDFFEVWDGIAVKGHRRDFFQVTTLDHVAEKRSKIAACGFPARPADRVYGYAGRPARWRVLSGPRFEMPGEEIRCPVPVVAPRSRRERSPVSSAPRSSEVSNA